MAKVSESESSESSTTSTSEQTYKVISEDGSEIPYVIRGLRDDEVAVWSEFCASVFRYKAHPPPPSYFHRHYTNDPNGQGDASSIRVAFFRGTMVASCRLFLRTISMGEESSSSSSSIAAGGIGEVCTDTEHRKRGLSKMLLQNVISIMKERQLQVSLLHAAPAFFSVYQKAGGYASSTSHWSVVQVTTAKLAVVDTTTKMNKNNESFAIREASFPDDTERLSALHQHYSEQRFAGCIVRSHDYWNDYLSVELKGSLWVLVAQNEDTSSSIVAWLSMGPRGDRYQLREFGVDEKRMSTCEALSLLLSRARAILQAHTADDARHQWPLVLPTFVLDQIRLNKDEASYVDWPSEAVDNDLGWMYKILDDQIKLESINGTQTSHLIWPADSF
jgi:predicted GNAT family N-acyltransferase